MPTQITGLPHSVEAEQAVIGSILIDARIYHEVRLVIPDGGPEFYIHRLRFIWEAFERLISRQSPIDSLTISEELEDMGRLDEIGGPAYLTSLLNQVPTTLHAKAYAEIVHNTYVRRRLLEAANAVAKAAYDETMEMEAISAEATHAVASVVRLAQDDGPEDIADIVRLVDNQITENGKSPTAPGIPTGLIDLDTTLGGGAQKGDVNILAGRPGDGKTSAIMQFALYAADYTIGPYRFSKSVGIFSLEMSTEQLVMRMIAQMTGIDFQVLRSGKIPAERLESTATRMGYYEALEKLSSLPIRMNGHPGATPVHVFNKCEKWASESGLDLVVIDSLNLMRSTRDFSKKSDLFDDNANETKILAGHFGIPVWLAHQENRGVEYSKEKPTLANLREGGEQPVDGVVFIWHDKGDEQRGPIRSSSLIVAKQRNGPLREIPVVFVPTSTKFVNAVRVQL